MQAEYFPKHRPKVRYIMSHMIADSEEELHAMADKIGVARRWFQKDHYDITQAKKALALKYGAKAITWRQCSMMTVNRRCGLEMGTPETAPEIAKQRWTKRRIEIFERTGQ
ncbi:MAG: DUF4031 domain-containing protein [bacterium]